MLFYFCMQPRINNTMNSTLPSFEFELLGLTLWTSEVDQIFLKVTNDSLNGVLGVHCTYKIIS